MLEADPECFIVAGSVSCLWEPSFFWTDACFKKGILESGISGWTVHPYGFKTPEEHAAGYARVREIFADNGVPDDFPLLNSERGFSLEKLDEGWSGGLEENAPHYQAWHLVRQYMIDLMYDVRLTIWYEWSAREFGLIYSQEKRPAYYACVHMVDELSGYSFRERLSTTSDRDYMLMFKNDMGDRKIVAWTSPPPGGTPEEAVAHTVEIPQDVKTTVSACDLYGEQSTFEIIDDRIVVELTGAPKYISLPEPGHNASLSAITWPDAPESILQDPEWKHDTIPGFSPGRKDYVITLPEETDKVPALQVFPQDINAQVNINRAKTTDGPLPDRTTTIEVTAQDDTTLLTYSIVLKKKIPDPAVYSYDYLINNSMLTIRGVLTGTTVQDFFTGIVKTEDNLVMRVISGKNGMERASDDFMINQDTLEIISANTSDTTKYAVSVSDTGLNDDATLLSNEYNIEITGGNGTISGFPYGTKIRTVLEHVVIPPTATLNVIDENDQPIPLKMLNFDTVYVPTLASHLIHFEVIAQDMKTKILYQLNPTTSGRDAYVWSNLLEVNQQAHLISSIPKRLTVFSLLKQLWASQGATVKAVDQRGRVQTRVPASSVYQVVVTSRDGTNEKTYYLQFLGEEGVHAYVLSELFTVNQGKKEIYGITDSLTVEALMDSITPAPMSVLGVFDENGYEKLSGMLEPGKDKLVVISGNGEKVIQYDLLTAPMHLVRFQVSYGSSPVEDALIILPGDTLTTDIQGAANILLPDGRYEYYTSKENYSASGTITVAGADLTVDITLKEITHILTITVTDGMNPIKSAIVEIAGRYLLTNASGQASLAVAGGTYDYTVSAGGYQDIKGSVSISDSDKELTVTMMTVSACFQENKGISIYPNPSSGIIIIDRTGKIGIMDVRITGISGKLIFTNHYGPSSQNTIDMGNADPGIYFIQVQIEKDVINNKLIIN